MVDKKFSNISFRVLSFTEKTDADFTRRLKY